MEETDKHLNPLDVLHKLEDVMDDEKTLMVADGGDFVGTAAYILRYALCPLPLPVLYY